MSILVFKYLDRNKNGSQLLTADYFEHKSPGSWLARRGLSRSAFCEARQKLSWEAFAYLLSQVPQADQSWKGHTLRAVDGTKLSLVHSEEVLKEFPIQGNYFGEVHYPMGLLVAASNVLTGQITHALLGNKTLSEPQCLENLLEQFKSGDITLLDRGIGGKNIWISFEKHKQYFVGRLKIKGRNTLGGIDKNKKDQVIEISNGEQTMQLRIVRGPKLRTGSYLFLATNLLNTKKYKRKELLKLYQKRQKIETNFMELKNRLGLNPVHGAKKLNHILQDIYAAVLAQALVARIKGGLTPRARKIISFKATQRILKINLTRKVWDEPETDLLLFYHLIQLGRDYPRYSRQPENKWTKQKRMKTYLNKIRSLNA